MLRRWLHRPLKVLPSRAAYALWAQRYPAEAHNTLMALEQDAMLHMMPEVSGKLVLDAACGTGRYADIVMKRRGRVYGYDNSLDMLSQVPAQVPVLASDAVMLPFRSGVFEGVICGLAIGHSRMLIPMVREMARVVRPGGWVLVSDLHPFQTLNGAQRTFTGTDGKQYAVEHYLHTMEDTVAALQQAGLVLEDLREPQHSGKPVVVVWLARRSIDVSPESTRPLPRQ